MFLKVSRNPECWQNIFGNKEEIVMVERTFYNRIQWNQNNAHYVADIL